MNFKKKLIGIMLSAALAASVSAAPAFAFPAIDDDNSEIPASTQTPSPDNTLSEDSDIYTFIDEGYDEAANAVINPDITVYVNGLKITFDEDIRIESGRTLVPMRAIFEALGADVDWDGVTNTATAVMDGTTVALTVNDSVMLKNSEEIPLDVPARMFGDRTLVPVRAISEAFDNFVDWDEPSKTVFVDSRQNPMQGTVVTDDYRYPNYNGTFNSISVFDKDQTDYFGMELLSISDEQGIRYADTINRFAAAVPEVRVYNIIAPTSAEFYAKDEYRTHYTPAIHKIYSQLDDSVTGVNVVSNLMNHADENIYFHTDHHWTQVGAYYAYEAFVNSFGEDIDPYYTFDNQTIKGYNGSLITFTNGTDGADLLRETPDTLVLYSPKVSYAGKSYSDMEMTDFIKDMVAINPGFKNYDCFIEGDYPLTVFDTDVDNGKSLVIVKESYGNSFATWALNNFERVYIVDYRKFNNYGGNSEFSNIFKISEFWEQTNFTDLLILSYPVTVANNPEAEALRAMAE